MDHVPRQPVRSKPSLSLHLFDHTFGQVRERHTEILGLHLFELRADGSNRPEIYKVVLLYPGRKFADRDYNEPFATWTKQSGLEIHDHAMKQSFKPKSAEQLRAEIRAQNLKYLSVFPKALGWL